MEHLLLYRNYARALDSNKSLLFDESRVQKKLDGKIAFPNEILRAIPEKIIQYYSVFIQYEEIWTFKKNKEIRGFINIISLEDSTKDNKPPDQHGLTMFDYFVPEAGVGYYVAKEGEKPNDELYLLIFGEEPYSLNVDMDGYIQLLYMVRGFAYWQMVLLSFQNNPATDGSAVEEFKKWMPKVFPDFKWEEFVVLYEKVKLR